MNSCSKFFFNAVCSLLFVLLLSTPSLAQTNGGLRGLVVDQGDQSPLNLTSIKLVVGAKTFETFSNSDGFYQINGVPIGTYRVSFVRAGFMPQTLELKVVADKNTFTRVVLKS